ncbi:MAG: hypothetical protein WA667_06550 [Candidatus Nitrosopolaris sp.]
MGQQYKNLDEGKATNYRKKRILFVNDDSDTTAVMKMGLTRHGFEVETFVDSKSALQNFKAGVCDLQLYSESGIMNRFCEPAYCPIVINRH